MGGKVDGAGVRRQVDTLFHLGVVGALSDGQLLATFVGLDEELARAAFGVLVERHGPMVLRVCRQVLGNAHDAEDAFQATFLVLARRARSVRKAESVASWLYGVAQRTSVRVQADAARRRARERRGAEVRSADDSNETDSPAENWSELHEEVARLPERYREPIVLCYFEGLSTEAAAVSIGCPQGTVLSRLARGRDRLRSRLERRGVGVGSGVAGGVLAGAIPATAGAAVPAALVDLTVALALDFARNHVAGTAVTSVAAVALARGVLQTMTISKLLTLTAMTLTGMLAVVGLTMAQVGGGIGSAPPSDSKPAANPTGVPQGDLAKTVARLQEELAASNRQNEDLKRRLQSIEQVLKQQRVPSTSQTGMVVPSTNPVSAPAMGGLTPGAAGMMGPGGLAPSRALGSSGFGGGMMKAMGPATTKASRPGELNYVRVGDLIINVSANGDKVQLLNLATGRVETQQLPASMGETLEIRPIMGQSLIALQITGPSVKRIAVALKKSGDWVWHPVDLREPVKQALPVVGGSVVVYRIGRRIYAFSIVTESWAEVELPEGLEAQPVVGGRDVTVEGNGQIYTFNALSGKWNHIDIERRLQEAEAGERKGTPADAKK